MREQLTALRNKMNEYGVGVYVVSDKDEHLSEYTGAHFTALAEFSGFTGGDGTLAVAAHKAALWTDGRYFTQAENELKDTGIELMKIGESGVPSVSKWISENLPSGEKIGFDGKCVAYNEGLGYVRTAGGYEHVMSDKDICGMVWNNRPEEVFTECFILPDKYCGMPASVKLRKLQNTIVSLGAKAHVISSLDDIAWLLNIRAHDIPNNPVFMAYMIVEHDRIALYSDPVHFNSEIRNYLMDLAVLLKPYNEIFNDAAGLRGPVLIDRKRCSYELCNSLPAGTHIIDRMNPSMSDKCRKNETERRWIRVAQHRDSVAVTRFMRWFQLSLKAGITEWDCVEKLHEFRKEQEDFIEESFSTISAYGPNAAMAHYMPSPDRKVAIKDHGMYLVDSGGHYYEGTTDVTRTWACGEITEQERTAFTLTVIANLRLAASVFPEGTAAPVLDYAAREPFWKRGMNFNHGTGHGVGFVINVHEGPVGIRYKAQTIEDAYPLTEGMYLSDEPGYYEGGKFGVRIENMLLVEHDYTNEYGRFMRFNTCTFVPIDKKCIDTGIMTDDDIKLLNKYHAKVFSEISCEFAGDGLEWLKEACAEIGKQGE